MTKAEHRSDTARTVLKHMNQARLSDGKIVCDGCDHPYRTTEGFQPLKM